MEFWKLTIMVKANSYEEVIKMLEKAKNALEEGHHHGTEITDKSNYSYFLKQNIPTNPHETPLELSKYLQHP